MKCILLAIITTLSVAIAGEPLTVCSLSSVLTDIAQNVGGDKAVITGIVKAGIDPHDFDPTPGDIKKISQSKIVLASGLGMESYLEKLEKSVGNGPEFIVVGNSIKPLLIAEEDAHDHGDHHQHAHKDGDKTPDPHWWHSIPNVKIATNVIRDSFSTADPANKETYYTNAANYQKQLDALAKWAKLQIALIPRDKRILVTSHDALGYFAHEYGFEIAPVEGVTPSDQPSSKKVREIIEEIKEEGVKAIFPESMDNPKVLKEITKESGARIADPLYADGLGADAGNTYEKMMRSNINAIVSALK